MFFRKKAPGGRAYLQIVENRRDSSRRLKKIETGSWS